MSPVRVTLGMCSSGPMPGWTFLEGGAGAWRFGPLALVYLTMLDPKGRVWIEWMAAK